MCGNGQCSWFAVRVKPRWEKEVCKNLNWKGYSALLPLYVRESQWTDRVKQLELPLFPGYVFASFDPRRPLHVLTTPGVLSVVTFGKTLVPLAPSEVEAVQAVINSELRREPCAYPQSGDRVRVVAGPLRGIEGIVSCGSEDRLILTVTLLQRAISVQVKTPWLELIQRITQNPAGSAAAHLAAQAPRSAVFTRVELP